MKIKFAVLTLIVSFLASPLVAGELDGPLTDIANNKIKAWASSAMVVKAINAQNAKHAKLPQGEIDSLDKKWRAETKGGSKPMIDGVMANELSTYLKGVKEKGQGLYTEIFVMDNKGLNVGQSDVTSDYWQGDEAKWKKTYSVGPNAVHIGKIKKDESTQQFQAQVSVSIVDPSTKSVIGAVTVGVNVDAM